MSAVSLTWRGRNSRLFASWSLSPRYGRDGRDGQEDHHCLPVHLHSHHHLANQHNQRLTNGPSSLVLDILPYLITGPVLQHGRQFTLHSSTHPLQLRLLTIACVFHPITSLTSSIPSFPSGVLHHPTLTILDYHDVQGRRTECLPFPFHCNDCQDFLVSVTSCHLLLCISLM